MYHNRVTGPMLPVYWITKDPEVWWRTCADTDSFKDHTFCLTGKRLVKPATQRCKQSFQQCQHYANDCKKEWRGISSFTDLCWGTQADTLTSSHLVSIHTDWHTVWLLVSVHTDEHTAAISLLLNGHTDRYTISFRLSVCTGINMPSISLLVSVHTWLSHLWWVFSLTDCHFWWVFTLSVLVSVHADWLSHFWWVFTLTGCNTSGECSHWLSHFWWVFSLSLLIDSYTSGDVHTDWLSLLVSVHTDWPTASFHVSAHTDWLSLLSHQTVLLPSLTHKWLLLLVSVHAVWLTSHLTAGRFLLIYLMVSVHTGILIISLLLS